MSNHLQPKCTPSVTLSCPMWRLASRMAPNDIPLQMLNPRVAPFLIETWLACVTYTIQQSWRGVTSKSRFLRGFAASALLLRMTLTGGWRRPLPMLWGCSSYLLVENWAAHQQPEPLTLRVSELLWKQTFRQSQAFRWLQPQLTSDHDCWTAQPHHPQFPDPENSWEIGNNYCWGFLHLSFLSVDVIFLEHF